MNLLASWIQRLSERIAAKVADARAHAGKAATAALLATPDGRPTIRRADRSPSLKAAQARLDELLADLAGPSAVSREGMLRDAYAEFYTTSFRKWVPLIPDEVRVAHDRYPSVSNLIRARSLAPHGMELRRELEAMLTPIRRRLAAAVVLTSSRQAALPSRIDRLDAWERSARDTITRVAVQLLGDAEVALDRQAGRDLVRPKLIDTTPLELD